MGEPARYALTVTGIVQGVGFRPFVYGLAQELDLGGFVCNQGGAVHIEVEGAALAVEQFVATLRREPPPLATIAACEVRPVVARRGEQRFRIVASAAGASAASGIGPDSALCAACCQDIEDPNDRRHGYPFTNCTHCGPRLTIANQLPYDRVRTTMAGFPMCAACQREYDDPLNRRFHAQPTACPVCGPQLRWLDAEGRETAMPMGAECKAATGDCGKARSDEFARPCPRIDANDDALRAAADALRAGRIVAIKGLGGFHLACRADDETAVVTLRQRKARPMKPFALMVQSVDAARALATVSPEDAALLRDAAHPIVLLPRRENAPLAPSVAPHTTLVGIMLTYTPLHQLLCRRLGNTPLVMTSGNLASAPLCASGDEAVRTLHGIADAYLDHNRPIALRCDDSVVRRVAPWSRVVRRARGYAPAPLPLPRPLAQPTLAMGGHLKATFALGIQEQAVLSQHIGDLDDADTYAMYVQAMQHYERLHAITPARFVHDMHPDYASTRLAETRSRTGRLAVQHHHAHMASCMAEHGLHGLTLGVVFDGSGYGLDGTLWGGEFLLGDYAAVERVAHLRNTPLLGGERAMREPWRMALAHAYVAGINITSLMHFFDSWPARVAQQGLSVLARPTGLIHTSSMGRLFDAVAALVGFRGAVTFEGEAAQRLESLALDGPDASSYKFSLDQQSNAWTLDPAPVIGQVWEDVQRGVPRQCIARRFHQGVCAAVVDVCERVRAARHVSQVVLSGGVFMNALLLQELHILLPRAGFRVYSHRHVPSHDGGLSLGQLAIAAALGG